METLKLILGILVVVGVVYLLIKRVENRLVLFMGGLVLFIIAGNPIGVFEAFSKAIAKASLFEPIVTIMGYSFVMKLIGADKNLVYLLSKPIKKAGRFIIAGVVFATFLINISLTSTAGTSAAVGAIFIPLLVASGVHPAIAGAAVLAGTYGSSLNPGYPMNVLTAEIAGKTSPEVIANHTFAVIVSVISAAIILTLVAKLRKEDKGFEHLAVETADSQEEFKARWWLAVLPLLPVILIMGSYLIPNVEGLGISPSVLISLVISILIVRPKVGDAVKEFFKGMGSGFANIFGIIVCATVFTSGLEAVGLIDSLINLMISNPSIAKLSSASIFALNTKPSMIDLLRYSVSTVKKRRSFWEGAWILSNLTVRQNQPTLSSRTRFDSVQSDSARLMWYRQL